MPSSPEATPPLEDSLEELYEDAPCGYLFLRADGTILRANRTFLRSTGYAAEDVVGCRRLQDLLVRGSRIYHETHWGPQLELAGEVREIPAELQRADGTRLPVLVNAVLKRGANGEALAIRASLFDATDRRRYERELVRARDQQAAVARLGARALEGAPLPTLLDEAAQALRDLARADAVTIVERVDDGLRLAAHSGWPADALADEGQHLTDLLAPLLQGTGAADGLRERHGMHDSVTVGLGAQGRPFGVLALHSRTAGRFSEGDAAFAEGVANVLWSAVERRRADEATQHQALHDPLTGLPNRLLLDHRLVEEIARARRDGSAFALCLLDLDFFKVINDTLGHLAGDELLRAVADRLRTAVRGIDMVARLGGDEFVVLCGDVEAAGGVDSVAGRITDALRPPFVLGGAEHAVRASVGVVVGDGASAPESVLRDADVAMYAAKARGRGQHAQFDHWMSERARERLRVEAELRLGLRRGELRVFYQPVVTTDRARVVGMEALVRWQHPHRGLVAPAAFIPVAEECGLIVELGHQVLEQACRQLAAWRAEGVLPEGVGMAVNVSARQLAQPAFAAQVARTLAGAGLAPTPGLLGLEITEAVLMEAGDSPASSLAELARLGVGLLLDDFGTGASSLARLRRYPVDTVKVDRAFVSGLGNGGGEDDAIVAAVMGMANALGLSVVAEGVETPEQLGRLRELGCGRIQGYVFARPLPEREMRALLLTALPGEDAWSASAGRARRRSA